MGSSPRQTSSCRNYVGAGTPSLCPCTPVLMFSHRKFCVRPQRVLRVTTGVSARRRHPFSAQRSQPGITPCRGCRSRGTQGRRGRSRSRCGRAATGTLRARCERSLTGARVSARIPDSRGAHPYQHGRNITRALGEPVECGPHMHPYLTRARRYRVSQIAGKTTGRHRLLGRGRPAARCASAWRRRSKDGDNADQRMPGRLRVRRMQRNTSPSSRRLLRVLLLRRSRLSAEAGGQRRHVMPVALTRIRAFCAQ
jgi:hypothetical protein